MDQKNAKIVAPCGIDCFNCELFEGNVTEAMQLRLAGLYGVSPEKIACKGCADGHQCLALDLQGKVCRTLACVNEKGMGFCHECHEFPCDFFMPLADRAEVALHNMKIFNLCYIKRYGVERFIEEASGIRETYFKHKMVFGSGGAK